ncbi:Beta-galactosidase C-terminal domain [Streptomyces sp. AC550_RSS872]|uniref:Beta-galactosidase C-terminal domain n=1 Tax=Streptomyces sp. AC550_RSS872 TaxID=2823689 RepID=UPI0020B86B35|nr:Beta-galactosidase C-terminal domain [Streptomyces sp. AC550_RSS872]
MTAPRTPKIPYGGDYDHAPEPAHLTAHTTATDLLTGKRVEESEPLTLDPLGVVILRLQPMVTTRAQDGGVPGA